MNVMLSLTLGYRIMRHRIAILGAVLAATVMAPSTAAAQRTAGVIGQYSSPRTWPQGVHDFDLIHQRIAVQFDEPGRLVTGEVTTTVVPGAGTDTIRLNAENIEIDRATDARGRRLRYEADTSHVTVRLPRRAAAGDTVIFTLAYHTNPERGIYFVPRRHVIWSQGEATETRAWIPTYDNANDKTTWEFLVTADSSMSVLSNGTLESVNATADGRKVWHWVQDEPASTYLYSVVVGPFTVLHDNWRGIPVDYWVYADTTYAGWRTFGETPSMIELYSRLLDVPFPWDKYDQSAIPDFTYGGMENVSSTTQTDQALGGPGSDLANGSRGLVAHELAHQWFGDLTTTANWANIWLNEGLTTYMTSVQYEKTRGWDAAQIDWFGQQQQAMQADENEERPLVWGEYQGDDPITLFFSGHVYPKGAQLAHQLRRLLGDSIFWKGMHRFLVDNAHRPVTTPDYAIAFEKTCNCDLDWFFDQWAYGIGYPRLDVKRRWNATTRTLDVSVEQTQKVDASHPLFRFPVTIRVVTRDSVVRQEIMVSKKQETFAIHLPGAPLRFRFDEGGWLLGTVHTDQSTAELAEMARHDLDTAGRNWALRALAGSSESAAIDARRFVALSEHEAPIRMEALDQMVHDSTPAGRGIVTAALRDPDAGVRSQAIFTLSRLTPASVGETALAMFRSDPDPGVRASAIAAWARASGSAGLDVLVDATGPNQPLNVRLTAAGGLSEIHDPRATAAIERIAAPVEPRDLRRTALDALVASGDTARALAVATNALEDYDPLFAVSGVNALSRLHSAAARTALERRVGQESRVHVRDAMRRALANWTRRE